MAPRNLRLVLAAAAICAASAGAWFYTGRVRPDVKPVSSAPATEAVRTLALERFAVGFEPPPGYFVLERPGGPAPGPVHAVTLMEDTAENRDLAAGRTLEAREGPPTISLEIFRREPADEPIDAWARRANDSNFRLSPDGELRRVTVAGGAAVRYRVDGLYPGQSVAVARGPWIYVWSVAYLSPQDRILRDFELVLHSVRFD